MKPLKWILFAGILLAAVRTQAQDNGTPAAESRAGLTPQTGAPLGLTLKSAQEEAIEHSPLYLQQKFREEELGWKQFGAFTGFLPHISLSAVHFIDDKLQL